MIVTVTRLRHLGARLSKKDLRREDPLRGTLAFAYLRSQPFLSLHSLNDNNSSGCLATLFQPALQGLGHGRMRFMGVERVTGFIAGHEVAGAGVVQEWLIEIHQP